MGDLSDLLGGRKFDASKVDTSNVIAKGTYKAIISKTEIKVAKTNGKKYVSIEFTMLSPSVNGRKFWLGLHFQNDDASVRERAEKDLGKIGKACGLGEIDSVGMLLNRKMQISLTVGTNKKTGELQNNFSDALPWTATMQAAEPAPQAPPSMPSVPDDDDEAPYWEPGRE
jgi:hypothetical protein